MSKTLLSVFSLALVFLLAACGGGNKQPPPPPISVSISPAMASVEAGMTTQFTATVSNTSNAAVTWQVNGVAGGSTSTGTISASGLYTAPANVATATSITVTVISQADGSKSATANVTVTPAIVVTISPTSSVVAAYATQQFTATIKNTTNTGVIWSVSSGLSEDFVVVGRISTSGLYTAPLSPPPSGVVTITAVSRANPIRSASASVKVNFGNASLQGQYAFSFSGSDASGWFISAGTITADGNGNITSGLQDLNHGSGVYPSLVLTGTYSIGPDGRGTATLNSSRGTSTYSLVLRSWAGGRFMQSDTTAEGSGTFEMQNPNAFLTSALNGTYAFKLNGLEADTAGAYPFAEIGSFTADGAGAISGGSADTNYRGTVGASAFTGTYTVAPSGRGTVVLTDEFGYQSNFAFYVVYAGKIAFVSLDYPYPALRGMAEKLQNTPFSNASLNGAFVFGTTGDSAVGTVYDAGRFSADGAGNIFAGVFDENDSGSVSKNVAFTGWYSITGNGRGTAVISSSAGTTEYIFYLVSRRRAYLLENAAHVVSGDLLIQQPSGAFDTALLQGTYALGSSGVTSGGAVEVIGQFIADGSGNFSGTRDISYNGTLTTDVPFTGLYSLSSNGRGTATLTDSLGTWQFQFYVLSGSDILLFGVDTSERSLGFADAQFWSPPL